MSGLNLRAKLLLRYLRASPRVVGCAEMAESLDWSEDLRASPADVRCVLFSAVSSDLHVEFSEFRELWEQLEAADMVRDGDLHGHTLLTFRFGSGAVGQFVGGQ